MKEEIANEVMQHMMPYLDNLQAKRLQEVLVYVMYKYSAECGKESVAVSNDNELVHKFIDAKRIEGCSEKTLKYYEKTIKVGGGRPAVA